QGRTVLIVTHGSVVRSLIKVLEDIDDKDIRSINVPTGVPMVYSFGTDEDGNPQVQGPGRYLDQQAANQGMAETAALGR
ncbi:MAG: phosphoglyceromutase, partial [Bifidobacteriales bacterium]|nr:phosphoglyceromutase [Bifidobacteriales bacterium]